MTSSTDTPTADELRHGYLPRLYQARSALERMVLRIASYRESAARARVSEPGLRVFRTVDALSRLHTLVENLLQIYELIAEQVDIRHEGMRRSLQGRISERQVKGRTRFQQKIWIYTLFKHVSDDAFARRGLDAQAARATIEGLAERSVAYLDAADETLRQFQSKYEPFCVAQKHGRSLFAMEVQLEESAPRTGTVKFRATPDVATVIQPDNDGDAECQSLTVDDELADDMGQVAAIVEEQVPRLAEMLGAITIATEQALDYIEGRRTDSQLQTQSFHFFAAPYSDEEVKFLQSLRAGDPIAFR